MVRVDVGRYLEDEACKLRLFGLHHTLLSLCGLGAWGNLYETVEQFLHAEVVECRTEEDGSHLGRAIGIHVELRIDSIYEFQVF